VRRATRTLFDTYPLLAGRWRHRRREHGGLDDTGKEQWCWDTFGGVQDACGNAQNRRVPITARPRHPFDSPAHQTDLNQIISYFNALPGYTNADSTLTFSYKYSQAHMHSSTSRCSSVLVQHDPRRKKTGSRCGMTTCIHALGRPDFARSY